MSLITRKQILERQYNELYPALEISKLILEALETLPPDLQLESRIERTAMGMPVREEVTIAQRVQELKRDIQILEKRVKVIEKELANEK